MTNAKLSWSDRSGLTAALAVCLGSGLMAKIAEMRAKNERALSVTRPPTPMGPIRNPPIIGPMNWATLNAIEFSPMALTMLRRGTRRGYTV